MAKSISVAFVAILVSLHVASVVEIVFLDRVAILAVSDITNLATWILLPNKKYEESPESQENTI